MINFSKIKLISLIVFSVALNIFISYLGKYSYTLKTYIGISLYFLVIFFLLKKINLKPAYILIIFLLPVIGFNLLFNMIEFKATLGSLPSHVFIFFSIFAAYFWHQQKRLPVVLLIATILLYNFYGKELILNKLNYDSFSQTIKEKAPVFNLKDTARHNYSNADINRLTVLEFWNSRCKPCYKQFPIIDSVVKNKKLDYDIFVVNVPLHGEIFDSVKNILTPYGYSFNQLFFPDIAILDSFKIGAFPTTIIILKNEIIFRGEFINAISFINKSLTDNAASTFMLETKQFAGICVE